MGAAKGDDTDFFAGEIRRLGNIFLYHQTKRKLVERGGDDREICPLINGSYQRGAINLPN